MDSRCSLWLQLAMKLFMAVNFDEDIKLRIKTVQDKLKKETQRGKFSLPENLHLTLVFLGETAEDRLPEIKNAMEQTVCSDAAPIYPFDLIFSCAGFFKRGGKELWYL